MDKFCDDFKNMLRKSTLHITRERHFVLSEQMFKLIKLKGSIITLRKLVERSFDRALLITVIEGKTKSYRVLRENPQNRKLRLIK